MKRFFKSSLVHLVFAVGVGFVAAFIDPSWRTAVGYLAGCLVGEFIERIK